MMMITCHAQSNIYDNMYVTERAWYNFPSRSGIANNTVTVGSEGKGVYFKEF